MPLNRRGVLKAGLLSGGAAALAPVTASAKAEAACSSVGVPGQRATHQQQSYIDFSGGGEAYVAPAGNRRTVDYLSSLSDGELLRRHWQR